MAVQAGLRLAWSETPEDTFSHDGARLYVQIVIIARLLKASKSDSEIRKTQPISEKVYKAKILSQPDE